MTYDEICAIEDYDAYCAALTAWYEACEPELGDIYVEPVKIRMALAELMGFGSHTDMALAQNQADYTAEMMAGMLDEIAVYLAPVYVEAVGYYIGAGPDYVAWADFLERTLTEMDVNMGGKFPFDAGLCAHRLGTSSG